MTKNICVYTCITGDYDHLHEIEQPEKNIDYYCFTNNKNLKSKTWTIIYINNDKLDNCRLARKIKILGHPKVNAYDIAVWSDADVVWQKPITHFIKQYFKNTSFSIFKHHARNNIYDEAITCLRCRKDDKDTIQKTLDFYRSVNFPDNNGLCESTVFIKNPKDKLVTDTMQQWFNMVKDYSRRDQLSFNYAIWKTGLSVFYIPLVVWDNPWFYITKHTTVHTNDTCHVYYGDPNHDFNFAKYRIYPYQIKNNVYSFTATIPNDTDKIEFNVSSITGTEFNHIVTKPTPDRLDAHCTVVINNQKTFFCNECGTIQTHANYKKGQKLSFSIELHAPNNSTLTKIIEYQWVHYFNSASALHSEIASLQKTNASLQTDITKLNHELDELRTNFQNITNSKGWQTLEKLRKLTTPLHRH